MKQLEWCAENMRCLSCKYDLSKLTENRCPECGRGFDRSDVTTFDDGSRPLNLKWAELALVVAASFSIIWLCVVVLSRYDIAHSTIIAIAIAVMLFPFEAGLYVLAIHWRDRKDHPPEARRAALRGPTFRLSRGGWAGLFAALIPPVAFMIWLGTDDLRQHPAVHAAISCWMLLLFVCLWVWVRRQQRRHRSR